MTTQRAAASSCIYVLGEAGLKTPVKIGMTEGRLGSAGRSGLSAGNWRELEVLGHLSLPVEDLRWSEWLIHQRLRPHHVRGEWFRVRKMVAGGGWADFLDAVLRADGSITGLDDWSLAKGGCSLSCMKRIGSGSDRRQFDAVCTCAERIRGEAGEAMASVMRRFAIGHLGLEPSSGHVRALARQVHHRTARGKER